MFDVERRSKIMAILNEKKNILVQETAALFGVTEETIRRDLKKLENQGLIVRTHGGAVLPDDMNLETPLNVREGINIAGKKAIGRLAAGLIKSGDTVFLDASTSSLHVAKHIKDMKSITVITNSERVLTELADSQGITLISTGGIIRKESLSLVGRMAENAVMGYRADKVFFSCKGFSPKHGLTDSSEQESEIRKAMLQCSETVIFLCDHTKFDKIGFAKTADLSEIDVMITDVPAPEGWAAELEAAAVKIKVSGP